MSDMSRGPGWWQATDGKWYPPEAASGGQAAASPTVGTPWTPPGTTPSPTSVNAVGSVAPSPYPSGPSAMPDAKGFVKSLYDFKFDHFITPKVLRFFYAFAVIVISLFAVGMVIASFAAMSEEPASGFVLLLLTPIVYLVYLVITRLYFELIAAFFRIADDIRAIRVQKGA